MPLRTSTCPWSTYQKRSLNDGALFSASTGHAVPVKPVCFNRLDTGLILCESAWVDCQADVGSGVGGSSSSRPRPTNPRPVRLPSSKAPGPATLWGPRGDLHLSRDSNVNYSQALQSPSLEKVLAALHVGQQSNILNGVYQHHDDALA